MENGVTNGVDAARFAPDDPCTRAQVAAFLHRCAGSPAPLSERVFADVQDGDWFADAVNWAGENRITNGVDAERFAPREGCTRAQIVTFLYRAHMTDCL